jgi:hypothetical protein
MPHFSQREGRFFVSYVTGPSHVTLGLSFSGSTTIPRLVKAPATGACLHGTLDEGRILSAVSEGIAKAASDASSPLYLTEIVYVESDSPSYDLFRYCAYLICRRLLDNEPFSTG